MIEFLAGAAVATYLLVAAFFIHDGVRGWEWLAVALWPIALPLSPAIRYVNKRRHYVYRDDPQWGPGWYRRNGR